MQRSVQEPGGAAVNFAILASETTVAARSTTVHVDHLTPTATRRMDRGLDHRRSGRGRLSGPPSRSPLVVLSSSVAGRVAAAALLLWLLAAMTTCMLPTLTQPERFARYVAYYEQRHALWSGLAAPPDLVRRLLGVRARRARAAPACSRRRCGCRCPQPGWLPQWSVLLALTQLTCALAAVAFLPPLHRPPLPPELRGGAPLVTSRRRARPCLFHLPAKLALGALYERRQLARSWRVTSDGWLERHNLARALHTTSTASTRCASCRGQWREQARRSSAS